MKIETTYTATADFEDLSPGDIFIKQSDDYDICYIKLEKDIGGINPSETYNAVSLENGELCNINDFEMCVLAEKIEVRIKK